MHNAINAYRARFNKGTVSVDARQNNWCTDHCWAMVRENTIFHTMPAYLNEWGEIVAECWQYPDWGFVQQHLLDIIDHSDEHRNILLNSDVIGSGIVACKGKVYLVIRGKKC